MPAHVLILLAACALNILPMLINQIGGDIVLRLASIHCYGSQFWQGDILPRWCFEGDTGLGSPIFAIYPPFVNILTSLLYPIHFAGASVYAVYVLAVLLATLVTAFGAYKWLAPFAGSNAALVGAVLYLFMPYRSEVMVARSGLPELWVMAFAPLMAHSLRQLMQYKKPNLYMFSVWGTLSILTQPAVTICILIGMGIYAFFRGLEAPKLWWRFVLAGLGMGAGAAFYLIPAMHYMPFMQQTGLYSSDAPVWCSRFVLPLTDIKEGRAPHIIILGMMILAFGWLAQLANSRRRRIPHLEDRQEIRAWMVAGVASIVLLFPISKPFWDVVNYLTHSGFPWRMQALLGMAISFLAAVYVRWLLLPGKRQLAIGDFLTAIVFLFCVQMFMVRTVDERDRAEFEQMVEARMVNFYEYQTLWTDRAHYDIDFLKERHTSDAPPPQVEMLEGTAAVRVREWSWEGIRIETGAVQEGFSLRIYHRYFPLWRATASTGEVLDLKPEDGTGYMILTLPRGSWDITIHPESRMSPFWEAMNIPGIKYVRKEVSP